MSVALGIPLSMLKIPIFRTDPLLMSWENPRSGTSGAGSKIPYSSVTNGLLGATGWSFAFAVNDNNAASVPMSKEARTKLLVLCPIDGLNNLIIRLLLSLFVVVLTTAKGRVENGTPIPLFRHSVVACFHGPLKETGKQPRIFQLSAKKFESFAGCRGAVR